MKMCHCYFFSYYYGFVVHNENYFYYSALNKYAEEEAILTFRGPCIVIYSYNKSQGDAFFLIYI